MSDKEIWRDIEGYEGLYKVSNLGRVKSLARKCGNQYDNTERILRYDEYAKGHLKVRLTTPNKKRYMVHRLVAYHFQDICGEFFTECDVHHKDFNPKNNRADNLICLTHEEHLKLHGQVVGKNVCQYDLNGNYIQTFSNAYEIHRLLGITPSQIHHCCNHYHGQKICHGFIWEWSI